MKRPARLRRIISMLLLAGLAMATTGQVTNGAEIVPPPPPEPSGGSQAIGIAAQAPVNVPSEPIQPPVPPDPLAPALGGTVEGINFDENASNTGFYQIPPDPIGAVGSNHLVSVVNSSIEWHTKAGVQQSSKRLGRNGSTFTGSFFETLSPTNSLFDPKVIYDQYSGRFVVVALEKQGTAVSNATNTSRILLAASATDDPNGTWYFVAFNSKTNLSGTDYWADYPGLAIDEEAIYLTMNLFTFSSGSYGGTRLWIVNKQSLYTNGPTKVFTVHDPYAATGIANAGTLQPAHIFGSGGVNTTNGTFLISAGWTSGVNDLLNVIRVDNPLTSPSFANNQFINAGNIHSGSVPGAPQSGTATTLDAGDTRPLSAVWRSNNLYAVNTVNPPSGTDSGQATAHWYRIGTTNIASLVLVDHGNIGGEDIATGTHTFYPSVAVDYRGNVGVGFAASASSIFPGAYYTGRLTTGSAGTMQTAGAMAAGVDYYVRTFGGLRNRWGDYSGIALDPAADATFWVFNEYALSRGTSFGGEDGRWGTRWGNFTFNGRPASLDPGLGTTTNVPVTFSTVKLATEPDGEALSFTVSATSANGGTVSVAGGNVTYTPPAGFSGTDTFTYTVDDGHGGTTNGTVTVTITTGQAVSLNVVSPPAIVDGNFVVRFAGIPGRTYTIEWSASVSGPWAKKTNLTAPTSDAGYGVGVFQFSESTGGATSRFYRTIYPAY